MLLNVPNPRGIVCAPAQTGARRVAGSSLVTLPRARGAAAAGAIP